MSYEFKPYTFISIRLKSHWFRQIVILVTANNYKDVMKLTKASKSDRMNVFNLSKNKVLCSGLNFQVISK